MNQSEIKNTTKNENESGSKTTKFLNQEKIYKALDRDNLGLSAEEQDNYDEKIKYIQQYDYQHIRKIERDLKENHKVNKNIIENIIPGLLDVSYNKLFYNTTNQETASILKSCKSLAESVISDALESSNITNKKLRQCLYLAKGQGFLFDTGTGNILFEIKENINRKNSRIDKNTGANIIENEGYYLQRHIADNANLEKMEFSMSQMKKLCSNIFLDKKIKFILSCSWLFDQDFNKFWIEKRNEKGNIRPLKRFLFGNKLAEKYGGFLEEDEIAKDQNYVLMNLIDKTEDDTKIIKEMKVFKNEVKSNNGDFKDFKEYLLTKEGFKNYETNPNISEQIKIIIEYRSTGKLIKEGESYIDLDNFKNEFYSV